jgi:hypothetical protein
MEALFTKITELADKDKELKEFFPGGGFHGRRPKNVNRPVKFQPYFTFRSAGMDEELGSSTCPDTASKTVIDSIKVRFQCWTDNDTDAMRGVTLLRKKYMALNRYLSDTSKLLRAVKGSSDTFEEPKPDDDATPLHQGVLEITYDVQTKPYA